MCRKPNLTYPCKCLPGEWHARDHDHHINWLPVTEYCRKRHERDHKDSYITDDFTVKFPIYCKNCDLQFENDLHRYDEKTRLELMEFARGVASREAVVDHYLGRIEAEVEQLVYRMQEDKESRTKSWWDEIMRLDADMGDIRPSMRPHLLSLPAPLDYEKYMEEMMEILEGYRSLLESLN